MHTKDLDLYIYNHSQVRNPDDGDSEYVAVNDTHDNGNIEQVNYIELDYYNSTDRAWLTKYMNLVSGVLLLIMKELVVMNILWKLK